jgi:hypothetical protein
MIGTRQQCLLHTHGHILWHISLHPSQHISLRPRRHSQSSLRTNSNSLQNSRQKSKAKQRQKLLGHTRPISQNTHWHVLQATSRQPSRRRQKHPRNPPDPPAAQTFPRLLFPRPAPRFHPQRFLRFFSMISSRTSLQKSRQNAGQNRRQNSPQKHSHASRGLSR